MRILGLDIGSKRIGVALSDELGFTAQSLETIQSKGFQKDITRIVELIDLYKVEEIVIGIPYNMDGSAGLQAEKIRSFARNLGQIVSIPIIEWDERLSTVAAERLLLEADVSRAKRQKVIDKIAAGIILQGYLDSKRFEVLNRQ